MTTPTLPSPSLFFDAVEACARAILAGEVIQTEGVSAGRDKVIDWRSVRCGEILLSGGCAFDVAHRFVLLVGAGAALDLVEGGPPSTKPARGLAAAS